MNHESDIEKQLLENMHFFVAEIQQQDIPAVNSFRKRAETIYDESLSAYVKLVLRRPFSKIIVSTLYTQEI